MQTILLLSSLAVFISFFARFKQTKHALELSFLIIFLFTALRYNYGTDYLSYFNIFEEAIEYSSIFSIEFDNFNSEPFWIIICYLFKPIGFYGMIMVITAFFCYTYYSLIVKYVPQKYFWLAVFIYVFFYNIMLIQFSAIRQGLSIAIFINSLKYLVDNKKPTKYIFSILIAGFIHSSAFFMLVFVIFFIPKVQKSKSIGYFILLSFFILLLFGQLIYNYIPQFLIVFTGDRYIGWFESDIDSMTTIQGSILWTVLIFIVIIYSRFQSDTIKILFYLCSIFFLVYPLTVLAFLSDRMGYYFAPLCIVVFPYILTTEKNKIRRALLLGFFLIFVLYNFFKFFTLDYVIEGYSNYQTIFSLL